MDLTSTQILESLNKLPLPPTFWVAYSGGLDSQVLLHALAAIRSQLGADLKAIHINHGLQAEASGWMQHCHAQCEALSIPLTCLELNLTPPPGESIEAFARDARYRTFSEQMSEGDVLLTAHHQDDQAETLLLNLLRGSGPAGLAAMGPVRAWAKGYLARPLLGFSRQSLQRYAQLHGLTWVDDPSNADTRYDRNFLRHQVMPLLAERWPACTQTISRSAEHMAVAQQLIEEQAQADLAMALGAAPDQISIQKLLKLNTHRQDSLLRYWIKEQGFPVPNSKVLARIRDEAIFARQDRTPLIQWSETELRRYRDILFLMKPLALPPTPKMSLSWNKEACLTLPEGLGQLTAMTTYKGGIDLEKWSAGEVHVSFRPAVEKCFPCGQSRHRTLKNLFQEMAVPPWVRERLPMIFIDGQLAAVPGFWVCQPFCAKPNEPSIDVNWLKSP